MIVNSAAKGWKNLTFDIGQAYLNAELTGEKVHVKLDRTLATLLSQVDNISEDAGKYDQYWKSFNVLKVDMLPEEIKKLEEFNRDCEDLGCPNMKCTDDNGVKFLMMKLKGSLTDIGVEPF